MVVIHLTNTLEDVTNVNRIVETIKRNDLRPYLRTVLILSGKLPEKNFSFILPTGLNICTIGSTVRGKKYGPYSDSVLL